MKIQNKSIRLLYSIGGLATNNFATILEQNENFNNTNCLPWRFNFNYFFLSRSKNKYKDAEIHLIVNKGTEDILAGNKNVTRVIPFDKSKVKSLFYIFLFYSEFTKEKFDICLCPHFSHRSSLISFFRGAKKELDTKKLDFPFTQ